MADAYRTEYQALFASYPLPAELDSIAAQQARLEADGTCKLVVGVCPAPHCRTQMNTMGQSFCLPRFPLRGKPGYEGRLGVVEEGVQRLCQRGMSTYPPEPFADAYDCMDIFDQRAVTRIFVNWAKAIAAYEHTLVSRNSLFDRFVAEGPDSTLLSPAARRGARLFVGKASCVDCHSTPLFSDGLFHNVGVPQIGDLVPTVADCPADGWCDCVTDDTADPQNCLPIGYREGLRRLQSNTFRRDSFWSDDTACQSKAVFHSDPLYIAGHLDECEGRVRFYAKLIDTTVPKETYVGRWRTPSLRDVALTGPYMHNGVFTSLTDVLWHYNRGGSSYGVVGAKSPRLRPLALTEDEMSDLVAFLESLDGEPLPPELTQAPADIPPP